MAEQQKQKKKKTSTKLAPSIRKLYGREDEIKIIRECLLRAGTTSSSSTTGKAGKPPHDADSAIEQGVNEQTPSTSSSVPLVFVSGLSGTGKTALIEHSFWNTEESRGQGRRRSHRKCLFGGGKFELTKDPTPYGVLVQALRQITLAMIECSMSGSSKDVDNGGSDGEGEPKRDLRKMYAKLATEDLQPDELKKLLDLIPELVQLTLLLDNTDPNSPPSSAVAVDVIGGGGGRHRRYSTPSMYYSKEELEQLKFTIRTFLRKISTPERPVVLHLDDVQWIDDLSLEVIKATLMDNNLKHFLFIASFRNNEVYPNNQTDGDDTGPLFSETSVPIANKHKIAAFIETLKVSSRGTEVRQIHVKNLSLEKIQSLLEDVLRTIDDDDRTRALADFFADRTNGNAFHVIELLDYLETKRLLEYSNIDFRWTWDLERIRDQTMVTSNVAEMLKMKISLLSTTEIEVLKQCSFMGYRFHEGIMPAAVGAASRALSNRPAGESVESKVDLLEDEETFLDPESSNRYLEVFLTERLLERFGDAQLKFTHDKVHRAVLDLSPERSERNFLHFNLGMELYKRFFENVDLSAELDQYKRTEQLLFLCVDRLNSGFEVVGKTNIVLRERLCDLNYLAAARAAECSAFDHALIYSQNGIDLLQFVQDPWLDHYDLTLGLHNLYVRMCFCNGSEHDDELAETVNLIVANATCPEDAMDAQYTLVQCLGSRSKLEDMFTTVLAIMKANGEEIPSQPSRTDAGAVFDTLASRLQGISDEDIMNLPLIDSYPLKNFCLRLLEAIFHNLDQSNNASGPARQVMCGCRMVEITLKYGIGEKSSSSFCCFSNCVIAEYVDTRLGARAANLSSLLFEKFKTRSKPSEIYARTLNLAVLHSWHRPLSLLLDRFLDAYWIGLRSGDVNLAFHAVGGYTWCYFYSGLTLQPFILDMQNFLQQMNDYGQNVCVLICLSSYQCALNLIGGSFEYDWKDAPSAGLSATTNIPAMAGDTIFDIGGGSSALWRGNLGWIGKTGTQSDLSYLLQVAIFCRNFDLAVETKNKLIESGSKWSTVLKGCYIYGLCRAVYLGLVSYWQVKRCSKLNLVKRQRLLKEAKKYHELVRKWVVEDGNINLPQKLLILDAEELSLTFKEGKAGSVAKNAEAQTKIKLSYEKAIVTSMRSGFTQDAALAAHLASEAIRSERETFWERAREFYLKWGAKAVVQYVEENRQEIDEHSSSHNSSEDDIPGTSRPGMGGSFRARTRFSEVSFKSQQESSKQLLGSSPEALSLKATTVRSTTRHGQS